MGKKVSLGTCIKDVFLVVAAVFGLLLLARFVPLIGACARFCWALPVIRLVYKDGAVAGAVAAIFAAALAPLFFGGVDLACAVTVVAGLGFFYGLTLAADKATAPTVLWGAAITVAVVLGYFLLAPTVGGVTLADLRSEIAAAMREAFAMYDRAGLLDIAVTDGMTPRSYIANVIAVMTRLLPSFYVITAAATAVLNYFVAAMALKLKDHWPPPFIQWHLPWWSLWGPLAGLMAYVIGSFGEMVFLSTVAQNIFVSLSPLFFIAGVSLAQYVMVKLKLPRGGRVVFWLVAAVMMSFSLPFLTLIGAADALLDYRTAAERRKNEQNNGGTDK